MATEQEIKEVWNGLKDLCENGNTHEIREIARKSLNLITDMSEQSKRLCDHIDRLTIKEGI